jgi:hypothetical protein
MHTEQIRNLHPGWVVGGWLVAIAVAGVVFMVLVGLGLAPPGASQVDALVLFAVAAGFFSGGFFVGLRWSNAPILHGVAITFLSVLVWFVWELLAPGALGDGSLGAASVLGVILLQLSASVGGGWTGRTLVRRGETPGVV